MIIMVKFYFIFIMLICWNSVRSCRVMELKTLVTGKCCETMSGVLAATDSTNCLHRCIRTTSCNALCYDDTDKTCKTTATPCPLIRAVYANPTTEFRLLMPQGWNISQCISWVNFEGTGEDDPVTPYPDRTVPLRTAGKDIFVARIHRGKQTNFHCLRI